MSRPTGAGPPRGAGPPGAGPPSAAGPPSGAGPPTGPGVPRPDDTPTEVLPGARAGKHARPRPTRTQIAAKLRAQLPFLSVALVVLVAFGRIALQHWREGTTELGLALLLAAVLRAVCTDRAAGLLAVRTRRVDIATYVVFGLVVILVSLTITGGPLASR